MNANLIAIAALFAAPLAAAQTPAKLPAAYHGLWSTNGPKGCQGKASTTTWKIDAKGFVQADGGGEVRKVASLAGKPRTIRADFELSGGGGEWEDSFEMQLSADGKRIAMRSLKDAGLTYTLTRCK